MSRLDRDTRWREALRQAVLQDPLLETRPSLRALERHRPARRPGGVFVGIGLCAPDAVSKALPLDALGLILSAERVRRAVGAGRLVVLIADSHAATNAVDLLEVQRRCREAERTLHLVRNHLGLTALRVRKASTLHAGEDYRAVLARVRRRAGEEEHPYFVREVADIACMDRRLGGLVKVGWCIGARAGTHRDERAFDARFTAWVGRHAGFVYGKAGRRLDDRGPKAPPYITRDARRRICLRPDEDVTAKLAGAGRRTSTATLNGVRRHLRALARSFSDTVAPLQGDVAQRAQAIIRAVFDGLDQQRGLRAS
jgi:hypothetical protein